MWSPGITDEKLWPLPTFKLPTHDVEKNKNHKKGSNEKKTKQMHFLKTGHYGGNEASFFGLAAE